MADKKYDIVIFGASGFTGQFVVEELVRVLDESKPYQWAVAGRSKDKLSAVLKTATEITGKDVKDTDILIVDVNNESTVQSMCEQSKIVLNCVGPYRFFGEQVVKACVSNGSHHIDICGEPEFLEKMQLNYNEKAEEAGVYVVGSCGFDSVPCETAVMYTRQQFPGILNTIESYLSTKTGPKGLRGNYATFQSAIHGFANAKNLGVIRKQFNHKPLPRFTPRLQKRGQVFYHDILSKWCIPFPGADTSVVRRTQRYLYEQKQMRPLQNGTYYSVGGLYSLFLLIVGGLIFSFMTKFKFGINLLENYPEFFTFGSFSKTGPTREQIKGASICFDSFGEGFSSEEVEKTGKHDSKIYTKVIGPEAGYAATPIIMVQTALLILEEKDKLPEKGGVFTPGAAFNDTTLIERLCNNGFNFSVVSKSGPNA